MNRPLISRSVSIRRRFKSLDSKTRDLRGYPMRSEHLNFVFDVSCLNVRVMSCEVTHTTHGGESLGKGRVQQEPVI